MNINKIGMLLCILLITITGCKIRIESGPNGIVTTESGAYECGVGSSCAIDVVDVFFNEKFIAVPNEGYKFKNWRRGEDYLCGRGKKPCTLTTSAFGAFEVLMAVLESDNIYHLKPKFEKISGYVNPTKTISIPGTWAFVETWKDKNNPSNVCTAIGVMTHEVRSGDGHYRSLSPESKRVSDVAPCVYTTVGNAGDKLQRIVQGTYNEAVTESELVTWNRFNTGVTITSPDAYVERFEFQSNSGVTVLGQMEFTRQL